MYDYQGTNTQSGRDGDDLFQYVAYSGGTTGGVDTLTGGAGRDTYQLQGYDAYYYPTPTKTDIMTDFAAGADGDILDLSGINGYLSGYSAGQNPFAGGYLRAIADGADTLIQLDRDASGTAANWVSHVLLQGVAPASLTVENFSPSYAPSGVGFTFSGSGGDDGLHGSESEDTIAGLGGNDLMNGRNGDDPLGGGKRDEKGMPVLVNVDGDRSSIRSKHLNGMLAMVSEREWRHPERPVIQIITPHVLVADEPVLMTQMPPISAAKEARRAEEGRR